MLAVSQNYSDFQLVSIELGGPIAPDELQGIALPDGVDPRKGVIFSGPGPIWLYGHLLHAAHHCAWVATHDPRLGGAVVVQRHSPSAPKLGEVIPLGDTTAGDSR